MTNRDIKHAKRSIRRRRRRIRTAGAYFLLFFLCVCLILLVRYRSQTQSPPLPEGIPDELLELLKHNEETYDFVTEYPNREYYLKQQIDLSADKDVAEALSAGRVPLLMQWDLRWGYAPYGDDIIGLAGCGPACLSMAYIHLTKDASQHPAAMAEFACRNGYHSEYGTSWALWTDGVSLLGLSGEVLSLSETEMKRTLRDGGVIICSMRPGDFTTTGHFILIRDYDENGFYVNDPNRRSNSSRQWTFDELFRQIKNLWGIRLAVSPMIPSSIPSVRAKRIDRSTV